MPGIDVVVPVWNRPAESRACLVSLWKYAPEARLILVNNGSDRETERLLEEFAEALDDRALLVTTTANLGFIKALNRGIARAEAEFVAIVRNTSIVSEGWLDPLLTLARAVPEAGIIVPRLILSNLYKKKKSGGGPAFVTEISHGEFSAMLIRKNVWDRVGSFNEKMDEKWCLWDFSRRSLRAGYLTFAAEGSPVLFREETPLGSLSRREEIVRRSMAICTERWGKPQTYCVYFSPEADIQAVRQKFDVMLRGARQGNEFTVAVMPVTHRSLVHLGCDTLHRNITLVKLPRLFAAGRLTRTVTDLRRGGTEMVAVAGIEGVAFPGGEASISFADLVRSIDATDVEKYNEGRGGL